MYSLLRVSISNVAKSQHLNLSLPHVTLSPRVSYSVKGDGNQSLDPPPSSRETHFEHNPSIRITILHVDIFEKLGLVLATAHIKALTYTVKPGYNALKGSDPRERYRGKALYAGNEFRA